MRGKGEPVELYSEIVGITPAYAGKSRTLYAEAKNYEDHPRLCGEKFIKKFPRCAPIGITPAYAGKRKISHHFGVTTEDHPRLCGEKLLDVNAQKMPLGSPPPMRGKVYPKI